MLTNIFSEAGSNYLSITFRRRQHTDIQCRVEVVPEISGTMVWTNAVLEVGPPLLQEGGFEQVTYRDTVPMELAPSRFMRLKLVQP